MITTHKTKIITRNEVAEDGSVQVKVTLPDDVKQAMCFISLQSLHQKKMGRGSTCSGEQIAHTISMQ
ncbi:hypothetical protein INT80_12500 [Gallibacterium anatis]|uniref:Uncharacterized protein n=1 Tax=Gallibacterium anatis TaxID=750 RepID=A0A930UYC1_9PAST|nr:hypothetical protein [Gallibacterium anatis]